MVGCLLNNYQSFHECDRGRASSSKRLSGSGTGLLESDGPRKGSRVTLPKPGDRTRGSMETGARTEEPFRFRSSEDRGTAFEPLTVLLK